MPSREMTAAVLLAGYEDEDEATVTSEDPTSRVAKLAKQGDPDEASGVNGCAVECTSASTTASASASTSTARTLHAHKHSNKHVHLHLHLLLQMRIYTYAYIYIYTDTYP